MLRHARCQGNQAIPLRLLLAPGFLLAPALGWDRVRQQSLRDLLRWCTWSVWLFAITRWHPWGAYPPFSEAGVLASPPDELGLSGIPNLLLSACECFALEGTVLAGVLTARRVRSSADKLLRKLHLGVGKKSVFNGSTFRRKCSRSGCTLALDAFPLVFALDIGIFHWTGNHLGSRELGKILLALPIEIVTFASPGILRTTGLLFGYWGLGILASRTAEKVVMKTMDSKGSSLQQRPIGRFVHGVAFLSVLASLGTYVTLRVVSAEDSVGFPTSQRATFHHPLLLLASMTSRESSRTKVSWVTAATADAGSNAGRERKAAGDPPTKITLKEVLDKRMRAMRMNVVVETEDVHSVKRRPDVLIILGESLRPELLNSDDMPHTDALAKRGLRLNQHYSGGNASSLGVFSIVSGLEAIWFYKSDVRFAPAMNRLFRQAGYELGFFASTQDWKAFQMDAFLSDRHYDRLESDRYSGLEADRRAIAAANQFLAPDRSRPPRLAVLCLYGTHAPFWPDPAMEASQPSAGPDYPIPFPPSWRASVWNRYRNAARTLDASIAGLLPSGDLDSSRVVLIAGDHGESFGEDGTIGHGTRLSKFQTRTLAVMAGPNVPCRTIDVPTAHFDFLPTLLAATGISTSMPQQLDGRNLLMEKSSAWGHRSKRPFSVASYAGGEVVLLGHRPHSARAFENARQPFWGLRCRFSVLESDCGVISWVGEDGLETSRSMENAGMPAENLALEVLSSWLEGLDR